MDIIKLRFDQATWTLQVDVFLPLFVVVALLTIASWILYSFLANKRWLPLSRFEIDEAEIGIGDQRLIIRPNHHDLQIAYQLWAELATRKIGLPIEEDYDLIIDVYASWYHFFCDARELIKTIPVQQTRSAKGATLQIVDTTLRILNDEMRPHLTRWHARFRQWWKIAYGDGTAAKQSPQELQRAFPEYRDLMDDLLHVNQKLVKYKETLREIAYS